MKLLKCPKCGNTMNYMPRNTLTVKNKKRCVYCGKTFKVVDYIMKE